MSELSERMKKHISALAAIGSEYVGIEVYCETADEVVLLEKKLEKYRRRDISVVRKLINMQFNLLKDALKKGKDAEDSTV